MVTEIVREQLYQSMGPDGIHPRVNAEGLIGHKSWTHFKTLTTVLVVWGSPSRLEASQHYNHL